jgi:hypothetical protein
VLILFQDGEEQMQICDLDFCHDMMLFDLPELFYTHYFCAEKPAVMNLQLRKTLERFMNSGTVLCPLSKTIDDFNIARKEHLHELDRITFEVDNQLSCGWLLFLDENLSVHHKFFLEYGKRFVLFDADSSIVSSLYEDPFIANVANGMSASGCDAVVIIRTDEYGMRWLIVNEKQPGHPLNDWGSHSRIVISDPQLIALRTLLSAHLNEKPREMIYLQSLYQMLIRDLVTTTKNTIRTNCSGCARSGDALVCSRGDSLCIELMLHKCIQRKRLENPSKCLESVYNIICDNFPIISRRIKMELCSV